LADGDQRQHRDLRHQLEALNAQSNPTAIDFAWPHLNSQDRYIRYAARLAIERNPVELWEKKALTEKAPNAALTALLALARSGTASSQTALLEAISKIPSNQLTEDQLLNKLRVIEVSIARNGVPTREIANKVLGDIDSLYPSSSSNLNRELCQILIALDAPNAVARTIELLQKAQTQEEQLTYIVHLRKVRKGWNTELRRTYLTWWNKDQQPKHPDHVIGWFQAAGIPFNNGASFAAFMANAHEEAKFTMTPDEILALDDVLTAYNAAQEPEQVPSLESRKLVKQWTIDDLQPLLNQVGQGRNFERGKEIYFQAQCSACHRFGDRGGAIGPDLTAVATRFKRQDLLESAIAPSKVLSEQYMNTAILTKDGETIVGRITEESQEKIVIRPNPLADQTITVLKSDVEERSQSKVSPMPAGLLDTFTREDVLDLLAYMESLGDSKHPNFQK